jgi:hypothetical protein
MSVFSKMLRLVRLSFRSCALRLRFCSSSDVPAAAPGSARSCAGDDKNEDEDESEDEDAGGDEEAWVVDEGARNREDGCE